MTWPCEGSDEVQEFDPVEEREMLAEVDREGRARRAGKAGLDPARVKPREDPPTLDGTVKPRKG